MRSLRAVLMRLAGLFGGRRGDRDFAAEVEAHLQSHIGDNLRAGMTAGEARRRAFLKFGGVAVTTDNQHDRRSLPWFESIARDTRHASRRLRRSPVFAAAAVLSLALAVGANASIFAVVRRVLLNPLPYEASDRLIALGNGMPSRNIPSGFNSLSTELYYQYLDRARTLDGLAIHRTEEQTLTAPGSPERIQVSRTTPSLASVLGVTPEQGRWFTDEEGAPGASPVAVISHGLWVRRFGQDARVLGQQLTLDGVRATIVGVMRPTHAYPGVRVDAWVPLTLTRATASAAYSYSGIARLRQGADVAAVRAELDRLGVALDRIRPESGYAQLVSSASTLIEATVRLSSLPGVTAAAASTCLPLIEGCNQGGPVFVEGRVLSRGQTAPIALRRGVSAGYFETMGMRVVSGRSIDRGDVDRNEAVVVINEALAGILFPNKDAIGQRVILGNPARAAKDFRWLTVTGVVSNTPTIALAEPAAVPQLFIPMFSSRDADMGLRLNTASFVIRTALSPLGLAEPARRVIGAIDSNLALAQVQTLQDVLDAAASQMAFTMVLLVIAAVVALLLGVIGIYGVMSYIVSQRTGEIDVRLALGARPASVGGMIVRQGGLVALGGGVIGLAAAWVGSRLIASLLFGVSPRDPAVFASTTLTLLVVALLACWLPARRAASVDPLVALRDS